MIQMIFLPGLSFSASNRRWAGAVKSVVCGRGVFLGVEGRAGLGERLLEGGDAVAAEGVVLRQRRDMHAGLADRDRVRDRVLRRVARGAEDVAVPLRAGDVVGDRGLDDQDLLVLLGDRQHGERRGGRTRADGDVGAVVLVGLGQGGLGDVRLRLVVLGDDDDLAPVDLHRPLGRVFEAHHEAGLGLLGVGLQRTGEAADEGDLEIVRTGGAGSGDERRGEG